MKNLFICVAVLGSTLLLKGQGVMIDLEPERIFQLKELEYYIDSTNQVPFNKIASQEFTQFRKHDTYQNKDFRPNMSYWVRFSIHHSSKTKKVWLLEFYDQTIDHLEAYVPQTDGTFARNIMGDELPFSERIFKHKNFEIQTDIKADTTLFYYFKIKSHEFADIRIAFHSIDRFLYYALNEYFLFGTFYGMILIISLYNFLVYLAIREIKNIYYIFYILSVALYAMSLDGVGFQYLWPDHPEWNKYAVGATLYAVVLWALIFTRRFLATATTSPVLDKVLKYVIAFRTAIFIFAFFFSPALLAYRNLEILPLSIIFFTGIKVWSRGYRSARFFVIAYGILFLGFFVRSLVFFNLLPLTILLHYSVHLSFVLEMLFLTFALGDRIRILKNNRDRAMKRILSQNEINMQLKDKVNRELELKVKERTLELDQKNDELAESNHKLVIQSKEINQINSLLDLDNWKLKNKVKEVMEERLHEKKMEYEGFMNIYPDTLSCYRFLENLKWKSDFKCHKCGNEKYSEGLQKFARRCTRCGYNESITAWTIFHGVKFPINKAFYIAYLADKGKLDITLENLSEKLKLRLSTVWAFKQKVYDRMQELRKNSKANFRDWEDMILDDQKNSMHKSKSKSQPQSFKIDLYQ